MKNHENLKQKVKDLLGEMEIKIEQIELESVTYPNENGEIVERFVLVVQGYERKGKSDSVLMNS